LLDDPFCDTTYDTVCSVPTFFLAIVSHALALNLFIHSLSTHN